MSKPLTRKEQYYANIAGEGVEIPAKPITREEAYLEKIAQGGGIEANPEEEPTGTLESLKIGDDVYAVPSGGGGGTSDYSALNNKPQINGVTLQGNKTTGDLNISYNDLQNKPSIPSAQIQSDWDQTDNSKVDYIKNKPSIPANLSDLNDDSSHRTVSDTEKSTWNGKSDFSGSYTDLTDKPTIPDPQVQADWNQTDVDAPDYIKNKPSVPSGQVQSDWAQTTSTEPDYIKNKPSLGSAASKNVSSTGDAGSGEVVMGNDSRLSDSRPASDVSSWAKQATKPTYTASEVGAIPSTDKGVNGGVATLGNDGIVPSNQLPAMFDGDYNSLTNKPTLGTAAAKDVPSAGNASLTEVVMGSDSRLSDDRNAKDVYPWAKAATKPTYTATEVGAIPSTDKGANGGVAELDANGLVPVSQLPSYVDDVLEGTAQNVTETGAGTYSATGFILSGESSPCVPESGKTYVDTTSNIQYRWTGTGTNFVSMGSNLALGETSSTAYRGDRGKAAYDHSQTTGNPHGTTKSDVGLSNVPNVSTNNQTPTFSQASTRNNIASGEKLSVIFGKIQKFFNDLKTVAFSGSYTDLTNTPTIPAAQVNSDWNASSGVAEILNKPSSYKPSSHTHGNIQNNGTLQTTDVAIANGDKLVVTDSSNSAKIARTSVAFDGTTTTQALSKKGTFETFSKFSGSYTDLTNKPSIPTSANDISYDNTDSGLTATDVQGAVDEVVSDLSAIDVSNYIDPMSTKTFTVKRMYCHMLFSTRTSSVSMIAYGNLVDMVNNSNMTVTVTETVDRDVISITNNNNLSTNIVLI